ncbi:hypothetical protein L1276_000110 [Flavobacterium sp. HSC-32F16]|uniref:hypothetical protein n=1 Tax=Flavobacterium sp. HSC-32F16 TaxID=2910964 RepID=UPI0020A2EBF3|nr:hypothetical protein [Flavobacterium sp. HSC-32F16]MCP2024970.1 hypothetical protein [Flavobacterium sp. HSC-32F16]
MLLTDEHIVYENNCRKMFVEEIIEGIIYGEIDYCNLDDENIVLSPEPLYNTKYSDIDSLDHSIYFKTTNKTIYVFWDNTFFSYGLLSKEIDLEEKPNDYEQKWDVSNEEKWINLIGQKIIDFKINWEKVSSSNLDDTNTKYYIYPQTFLLRTENEKTIILSASKFKDSEQNEVYGMSDNLLVTTNFTLAKELKLI